LACHCTYGDVQEGELREVEEDGGGGHAEGVEQKEEEGGVFVLKREGGREGRERGRGW